MRQPQAFLRSTFLFVSAITVAAAVDDTPIHAEDAIGASSTIDDSWNAIFDRRDGWTGADCAGTVDLRDGRILWLFGDSWIGSIRGGTRLRGATMVNNSIALHRIDQSARWKTPDPASVRFVWGSHNANGQPTAWAVPAGDKENNSPTGESREWLWANGGGLVVDAPGGLRRLFVFFFRVRRNPRGKGVWTFAVAGTTLGVVDNVAEKVDRWKLRLLNVPYGPQSKASSDKPAEARFTWGMAACLDPDTANRAAPDALIYGIRKSGFWNDALVLARTPAAAIDQFRNWRFYAGANTWSTDIEAAKPVANGMVSEFSIERMEFPTGPKWLLVQSEPLLGKRIFARSAPMPEDPWSSRKTLAVVPDIERNRSYFTYAAKGHAALSRPGELLITYLVNSQNFGDLVKDTTIYHPKFLRFPLSALSPP
jgi:hypothetical protein